MFARSVEVSAPVERAWEVLTDWENQGAWMPGTRVRVLSADGGKQVGSELEAWTGIGPLGFRDPMTLRSWEPPHRVVMRHHGPVVRGSGSFEVVALGAGRSRVIWTEWLDLPLGAWGRFGWRLVEPLVGFGFDVALKRLRRHIEASA